MISDWPTPAYIDAASHHPEASEDFEGGFQRNGRPLLFERVDRRSAEAGQDGQFLLAQLLFLASPYRFFDKALPIKAKVPFHRVSMCVRMSSFNESLPILLFVIAALAAVLRRSS
jgi:hypothetical protein